MAKKRTPEERDAARAESERVRELVRERIAFHEARIEAARLREQQRLERRRRLLRLIPFVHASV